MPKSTFEIQLNENFELKLKVMMILRMCSQNITNEDEIKAAEKNVHLYEKNE